MDSDKVREDSENSHNSLRLFRQRLSCRRLTNSTLKQVNTEIKETRTIPENKV